MRTQDRKQVGKSELTRTILTKNLRSHVKFGSLCCCTWGRYMTDSVSGDLVWERSCGIRRLLVDLAPLDRLAAVAILPFVVFCLVLLAPVVLIAQGRPFFFSSERMATPDRSFRLWKIRTMQLPVNCPCSVLGGDMVGAVTPVGKVLRKFRLDELPQIYNVLRGDMRFIGPRPPLRRYVQSYPDIYRQVLASKPGLTGLATVMLHQREDRILSRCRTAEESDKAYREYCILPKARLDLLYQRRRSVGLDLLILFRTVARLSKRSRRRSLFVSPDSLSHRRPVRAAMRNASVPQGVWRYTPLFKSARNRIWAFSEPR